MKSTALSSSESWSSFLADQHRRAPRVWRRLFHPPLATSEELLRVLADAGSVQRPPGQTWRLRFFLDGRAIEPPRELLPRREDQTLEAYAARMEEICPGREFGIILNNYHRFDVEHWLRLRDFFGPLFSQAGHPPGGVTADVFVGNYSRTPFGVHRDTLDVFTYVVAGHKRLLAWPAHVFAGVDPKAVDYATYLGEASVLEGEAGDMFYWPSSYWHIAESTGGLTATLALGEFRESVPEVVHDDMARFLEGTRASVHDPSDASHFVRVGAAQTMPEALGRAIAGVSERLRKRVVARYVERISNHGLSPPPPRSDELALDDTIRCPSLHPIVMLDDEGVLLLGACGRVLPVPCFPQIAALIEELNTGAPLRVDELIRRYAGEPSSEDADELSVDPEALLHVLKRLQAFRAFERH